MLEDRLFAELEPDFIDGVCDDINEIVTGNKTRYNLLEVFEQFPQLVRYIKSNYLTDMATFLDIMNEVYLVIAKKDPPFDAFDLCRLENEQPYLRNVLIDSYHEAEKLGANLVDMGAIVMALLYFTLTNNDREKCI